MENFGFGATALDLTGERGKRQIPPDLVVKIQTVDIVEVIVSLSRRQSASQGWVATGNHGVSGALGVRERFV